MSFLWRKSLWLLVGHLCGLRFMWQVNDDLVVVHDALDFGQCRLSLAVWYYPRAFMCISLDVPNWSFYLKRSKHVTRYLREAFLKTYTPWRIWQRCLNGLKKNHYVLLQDLDMYGHLQILTCQILTPDITVFSDQWPNLCYCAAARC